MSGVLLDPFFVFLLNRAITNLNLVLLSIVPVLIRIYYFHKEKHLLQSSLKAKLEYEALKRLLLIVPLYFVLIHVSEWFALGLYVGTDPVAKEILARNGWAPAFWTFFHVENSFSNTGYSLFFDNYIQWDTDAYVLMNNMFIAQCGDVAFPISMYLIVWSLHKFYLFIGTPSRPPIHTPPPSLQSFSTCRIR